MRTQEINFDALVGPTHHYGGLARGNLASQKSRHAASNPKAAALEGLAKMKRLADLGVAQGVLPPQQRPDLFTLRQLGFEGTDEQVLAAARDAAPAVLAACSSASAMWAANAATVGPSADAADARLHLTPANLVSQFHRSLETATTARVLRTILPDTDRFAHHAPLPATPMWADEGAANHVRLAPSHGERGLQIFVYGRDDGAPSIAPQRFPGRQSRAASEAVARLHQLDPHRTLFVQQNPAAIDAGAFHNDVVCVGNENVLLYHEAAFAPGSDERIAAAYQRAFGASPHLLAIRSADLPLADAVETYLFNSQLLTLPDGTMALVAPSESERHPASRKAIEELVAADTPVASVHFVDVRQSMRNGGGPACLRLRMVMTAEERAALAGRVLLDERLHADLNNWIEQNYRTELAPDDLADPHLLQETRDALESLTHILQIGPIYPFQL